MASWFLYAMTQDRNTSVALEKSRIDMALVGIRAGGIGHNE
jgi:hypothetical protein